MPDIIDLASHRPPVPTEAQGPEILHTYRTPGPLRLALERHDRGLFLVITRLFGESRHPEIAREILTILPDNEERRDVAISIGAVAASAMCSTWRAAEDAVMTAALAALRAPAPPPPEAS